MAFNLPVQNFSIPNNKANAWVRPSDWPVITDAANEVQFLMSDATTSSCSIEYVFSRTTGSQNLIIDWGDGTIDTFSATSGVPIHSYTVGSGTPCSRGYTTFKIRMYFTGAGSSILANALIRTVLIPGNQKNPYLDCGVLEAYYGNNTQTYNLGAAYQSQNPTSNGAFAMLEYVKLPSVVLTTGFADMFNGCSSLAVVVMPLSMPNAQNFANAFQGCANLRTLVFPYDAVNITSLANTFTNCKLLSSVVFPQNLDKCTTMSSTFGSCERLLNITIPSIKLCTTLTSTFAGCYSLQWIKLEKLPEFTVNTTVTATSFANNAYALENVYLPQTCSDKALYNAANMFSGCYKLKTITFPVGFNPTSLQSVLGSCATLVSAVFQSAAPALTSLSSAFSACYSLKKVVLPASVGTSITLSSAFQNCFNLETITIPDTYTVNSMSSTFISCTSLKTINWNPGVQNSLTSLVSCFQSCTLLESITLPTSMNGCVTLNSAFSNCRSLKTLVFPASMNAVTDAASMCTVCASLESVTLPTSMSACTTFSYAFSSCYKLKSLVLPATVSTLFSNFSNMLQFSSSIKSVTFPSSAQLSSVNNINAFLSYVGSNVTLINLDKIGSLGATPLVDASGCQYTNIYSLSFSCPFSSLGLNNQNSVYKSSLESVRLLNTSAGQWTGTSPQINVSNTNMSTVALVQLFNDMAAQGNVTSKTINITAATGAAGLTASDRLIVTSKGWTITG